MGSTSCIWWINEQGTHSWMDMEGMWQHDQNELHKKFQRMNKNEQTLLSVAPLIWSTSLCQDGWFLSLRSKKTVDKHSWKNSYKQVVRVEAGISIPCLGRTDYKELAKGTLMAPLRLCFSDCSVLAYRLASMDHNICHPALCVWTPFLWTMWFVNVKTNQSYKTYHHPYLI